MKIKVCIFSILTLKGEICYICSWLSSRIEVFFANQVCNYYPIKEIFSRKNYNFAPLINKVFIMKRFLSVLIICFISLSVIAQIELFDENAKKVTEPVSLPYDSLRNVTTQKYRNGDKVKYTLHHLVGQTLMYCGDPYDLNHSSPFVQGEYYRVDSILPDDMGKGLYYRMSLTNVKTGAHFEEGTLYIEKYNYRWVVVGHYEKMKALYMNKEFVYLGTNDVYAPNSWSKANGLINIEADTVTRGIPKESIWTCVGVQVKPRKQDDDMGLLGSTDKRSPIVLIFDNPTYGKHYCYLEDGDGHPYKALSNETLPYVCGRFQLKSYYDNIKAITAANKAKRKTELTKKFGAANANLIIEGKIKIGMTKAMCEEAWGYPDDINSLVGSWGTHEQWVYGNSYLYFEGDKLTAIQN